MGPAQWMPKTAPVQKDNLVPADTGNTQEHGFRKNKGKKKVNEEHASNSNTKYS